MTSHDLTCWFLNSFFFFSLSLLCSSFFLSPHIYHVHFALFQWQQLARVLTPFFLSIALSLSSLSLASSPLLSLAPPRLSSPRLLSHARVHACYTQVFNAMTCPPCPMVRCWWRTYRQTSVRVRSTSPNSASSMRGRRKTSARRASQ